MAVAQGDNSQRWDLVTQTPLEAAEEALCSQPGLQQHALKRKQLQGQPVSLKNEVQIKDQQGLPLPAKATKLIPRKQKTES